MKKINLALVALLATLVIGSVGCTTIGNIIGSDPSAVALTEPISMPLFYDNGGVRGIENDNSYIAKKYASTTRAGNIDSTWDYLSKSDAGKAKCREEIKATCASGEKPGITFMISTKGCAGSLSDFPNVTDAQIETAKGYIVELVKEGFVVVPCLYVDDPSGSMPNWTEINKHAAVWNKIDSVIGKYVSGYILSIETNERANSKAHIEGCVNAMRVAMPNGKKYGVHMQFHAAGYRYVWLGSSNGTTPNNVDFIACEQWQPQQGDAAGLNGMKESYNAIRQREPKMPLIFDEWNLNPNGNINKQQRDWLKQQRYNGGKKELGVG